MKLTLLKPLLAAAGTALMLTIALLIMSPIEAQPAAGPETETVQMEKVQPSERHSEPSRLSPFEVPGYPCWQPGPYGL
jgi:hypothetical protein